MHDLVWFTEFNDTSSNIWVPHNTSRMIEKLHCDIFLEYSVISIPLYESHSTCLVSLESLQYIVMTYLQIVNDT